MNSAQEVNLKNLKEFYIAFLLKKTTTTERSTRLCNMKSDNAKKLADGSHWQQRSKICAEMCPRTTDAIKRTTQASDNPKEDALLIPEAKIRPIVHFSYDRCLSDGLLVDYTASLMAIEVAIQWWVLNYRQLACFCNLRTHQIYKHVIRFLHVLSNQS